MDALRLGPHSPPRHYPTWRYDAWSGFLNSYASHDMGSVACGWDSAGRERDTKPIPREARWYESRWSRNTGMSISPGSNYDGRRTSSTPRSAAQVGVNGDRHFESLEPHITAVTSRDPHRSTGPSLDNWWLGLRPLVMCLYVQVSNRVCLGRTCQLVGFMNVLKSDGNSTPSIPCKIPFEAIRSG